MVVCVKFNFTWPVTDTERFNDNGKFFLFNLAE